MEYNSENLDYAKTMRSNMTKEEVKLWNILRSKKFHNFKFRRQHLIGNYIVDFVCLKQKLIIELDGGQHNQSADISYDANRTSYLKSKGFRVIRFWNNEVWNDIEGVCVVIEKELQNPSKSS